MKNLIHVAAFILTLSAMAHAEFEDIGAKIPGYCDQEMEKLKTGIAKELNVHSKNFGNLLLSLTVEQRKGLIQAVDSSALIKQIQNSISENREAYLKLESDYRDNTSLSESDEIKLLTNMAKLKVEFKTLVKERDLQFALYSEAKLDSLFPHNAKDEYNRGFFEKASPANEPAGRLFIGYTTENSVQKGDNRRVVVAYGSVASIDNLEYRVKMNAASYYNPIQFSPQFFGVDLYRVEDQYLPELERKLTLVQRTVFQKMPFCRGVKSSVESTELPTNLPFTGYNEFSQR